MQLDAVEAGLLRAQRRVGEQAGQDARQFGDVRQMRVGDALARAELQILQLAFGQDALEFVILHRRERGADFRLVAHVQCRAMRVGDGEEPLEELVARRAAADR